MSETLNQLDARIARLRRELAEAESKGNEVDACILQADLEDALWDRRDAVDARLQAALRAGATSIAEDL